MKPEEYLKLEQYVKVGGLLKPYNDVAISFIQELEDGEVCHKKSANNRDLKIHQAYFSFLRYVYEYMPKKLKERLPVKNFYHFLKYLNNEYVILFEFKGLDIPPIAELTSISFSKMDEYKFKEFINNQIPQIYELLRSVYPESQSLAIIETIEEEFSIFLSKLMKKTFITKT